MKLFNQPNVLRSAGGSHGGGASKMQGTPSKSEETDLGDSGTAGSMERGDEADVGMASAPKGKASRELGTPGADLGEHGGSGADSGGTGAGATALDAIGSQANRKSKRI